MRIPVRVEVEESEQQGEKIERQKKYGTHVSNYGSRVALPREE